MKRSWKSQILKDPKIKTALRLAAKEKSWGEKSSELLAMHSGRKSRTLFNSRNFLKATKISEAAIQDSAYRSRSVEIMLGAMEQQKILERYILRLSDYIQAEYQADLAQFKTVAQRDSAVRSLLEVMHEQLTAVENVIEKSEAVCEDIDKMAWSLSRAMDAIAHIQDKGREL